MRDKIINMATVAFVPPKRDVTSQKRVSIPVLITIIGFLLMASGFALNPLQCRADRGRILCDRDWYYLL